MSEIAELKLDGKIYELPIVRGSENDRGIAIESLRQQSGYTTLDNGFSSTASCKSAVTYIDGENGILRYRGYSIDQLAEHSKFTETAYLLIYGDLPNQEQMKQFSTILTRHSLLHEDMKRFFDGYPASGHPMGIISAMICSMSGFYPESLDPDHINDIDFSIIRLLSKARTITSYAYKKSIGQPMMYPKNDLSYCGNILHMMFSVPAEDYEVNPILEQALNVLLILHADHEQNCSTSTVRLVGSSQANVYASISAGICALWGPLHGGANQAVIEMLDRIAEDGGNVQKYVEMAKNKSNDFRLMGFGHRVYKNYDPRAAIIKKTCHQVLNEMEIHDPSLEIAMKLEEVALKDSYFAEKMLYPNVDFYSGIIYRAMGIPMEFFTPMFALGRLPGWLAHWKEMREDSDMRIGRPRQVYTGPTERQYVSIDNR